MVGREDIKARVEEQITRGHAAAELLNSPVFKEIVDTLAAEFFAEFRKAEGPEMRLRASLKFDILEELVERISRMYEVGRNNSQNMRSRT